MVRLRRHARVALSVEQPAKAKRLSEVVQEPLGELQIRRTIANAEGLPRQSEGAKANRKPKRKRKLPVWLTLAEFEALLIAAPGERDRLLVLVGAYAGLRVSEMCHLRVEHLDLLNARLDVKAGKGDKDRSCPLHPRLADALRAWLHGRRTGWVFASPAYPDRALTTRAVQRMVKMAADQAGITKRVTPHVLRHTFATWLREKGTDLLDIRDLLGHSSVNTTQIYAHMSSAALRKAVEKL